MAPEAMLCRLSRDVPEGSGWVLEPKWDGYRFLYTIGGGRVYAHTRNGNPHAGRFPYLEAELRETFPAGAVVDGEIVALAPGPDGRAAPAILATIVVVDGPAAPLLIPAPTLSRRHPKQEVSTVDFVSIRMITDDLDRTVDFYEQVTGVTASRPAPVFAEFHLPSCTLAIGHSSTVQLFGSGSARAADNHTVIIEFYVDDVDAEYERLKAIVTTWVQAPTTMPWGNRSLLFRDPDGNLVNLFTPVTEEARIRLGR